MFGLGTLHFARQLRCLTQFPQQLFNSNQLVHTCSVIRVRYKEISATVAPAGSQDILLQNIRSAKDSSDVLDAINRHYTIMNSNHVLQAFRSLFNLQKSQSSHMSNGEVIGSKEFRKLCEVLKSQVRHIELNDLIDVLKCAGYLGVPPNAKIINIILHLISKQVNDLSLQHITFLDFIMKDFKATPLVKALKIALPIVFEANLKMKCDYDNLSHLSDLLSFVSKRKHMETSADILVDAITTKREQLSIKDATNIVFSLCNTKFHSENYKLLLCHSLDVITDSLEAMDFFEMEAILGKLYSCYIDSNGDPYYYHEEFCNGCIRLVVGRNYSFEQNIWILKKIVKFNHTHLPFLDHIAEKAEQEPWQLEQCGASGLIIFLTGFSHADYRPPNWERIKPLVLKACQNLMDRSELPWLRIAMDLCVLDCWSEELLHKVFSRQFLSQFLARDNMLDRIQLLMLDQVSATLSPWAIAPRVPADLISEMVSVNGSHITSFPLQAALQHGLGGQEYVQTKVRTPIAHFLDHVIVMRKGGFPIAINLTSESRECISTDDIQVPVDSKMVAVLFVPSTMCAINTERVRGLFRAHINSIESLGIAVVPVLQPVWNTLPDFERIPYLMRSIRDKLPASQLTDVVTPV